MCAGFRSNFWMQGRDPQADFRLARIFDDADSGLWTFLRVYGSFQQALARISHAAAEKIGRKEGADSMKTSSEGDVPQKDVFMMITLAPIFTDHMVLQRGRNVCLFGSGTPGTRVEACLMERRCTATAVVRADGTFRLFLPPQSAGTGLTLRVGETVLHDVAFGEVWLAGGQSNMELMLQSSNGWAEEKAHCADSNVRCYQVPRISFMDEAYEKAFAESRWQLPCAETCADWSAVAYYAAKELAQQLGVPVGIIGCNFGGSSVSCWISEQDLHAHRAGHAYLSDYETATAGKTHAQMIAEYDAYVAYHAAWTARMEHCYQLDGNMPWEEILRRCGENRWPGPMGIKSPYRPAGLYHLMLQRIVPYTLAGVFYYQGENDEHRPDSYATLLTVLIARWRHDFLDDALPFLLVQLPMFAYADAPETEAWCRLREAQMRVFRTVKNTGLAVISDCGELGNIHPTEKRPVGHRLALQARRLVYGETELSAFGPLYHHCVVQGDALLVTFSHGAGMTWHGEPAGFSIAGADGVYHPAQAQLLGDTVRLTSPLVPEPCTVRYQWYSYGPVSLYGNNGIPAAPFRTDALPMPLLADDGT